jgi:hypothetical protein
VNHSRSIAAVLRLIFGAWPALSTGAALLASQVSLRAKLATLVVVSLTLWRPVWGLLACVLLAPAGLLLANAPVRTADMLVWAFLAAWLLSLWRPLTTGPFPHSIAWPLVLFGACAIASWAGYTIAGAPGVDGVMLPAVLVRAVPIDHLVFSSPEPETWAMLTLLTGLAFFAATLVLARDHASLRRNIAVTVLVSATVMAIVTLGDVLRQWSDVGFGAWYLLRYVRGERFSAHLADLNAAGSQYVSTSLPD